MTSHCRPPTLPINTPISIQPDPILAPMDILERCGSPVLDRAVRIREARHQASRILTARSKTGEPQRSRISIGARIGSGWIEIGVLIGSVGGRQCEVIAQPEIQSQLSRNA